MSTQEPSFDRSYVRALTGLRGMAALFVYLFHYHYFNPDIYLHETVPALGYLLQFPFGFGFMGVDLFFVLSGFLLTLPFAASVVSGAPRPSLKRYFRRRILRVFPAYYAQLFIILLLGAWFVTWKPLDISAAIAHLFMWFNIGPDPVRPLVGIWWTLPVEFSFYLFLPLLIPFMQPRKWLLVLITGLAISLAFRWWTITAFEGGNPLMLAASQLPGSLPEFLFGSTMAILVTSRPGWLPRSAMFNDLLVVGSALAILAWFWWVVLGAGSAYWRGHPSMVVAPSVLGVLLSVMVLGVYQGSRLGVLLFANRWVYFIGMISYSLYLWHFVVLQQLEKLFAAQLSNLGGVVRLIVCTGVVLICSWVSYRLFERPFYRQKEK